MGKSVRGLQYDIINLEDNFDFDAHKLMSRVKLRGINPNNFATSPKFRHFSPTKNVKFRHYCAKKCFKMI